MDRKAATAGTTNPRQPRRGVALYHVLALTAAGASIWLTAGLDHWSLGPVLVLGTFLAVSILTDVATGSSKVRISGVLIGQMVAIVLLGPGPTALLSMGTMVVSWLRTRVAVHYLRNNLVVFAWYPLVAGSFFHAVVRVMNLGAHSPAFYLVVFLAFVLALMTNVIAVMTYTCYVQRASIAQKARDALLPLMPAHLFSGLLTMAATYVAIEAGTVGILLVALVLLIFQYLVGELLKSKQRGEQLHRVATTDELTGLANRERFRARLDERIVAAKATDEKFGVMLLDLDRFKEVNDTLGHHYGDELLRDLGPRLAEAIGPDGLVARLGGDEFAVLPGEATGDAGELEAIAQRLTNCVQQPVVVDEMTLEVGVSVGVAVGPEGVFVGVGVGPSTHIVTSSR